MTVKNPSIDRATFLQIWTHRVRIFLSRFVSRLGFGGGIVKPFKVDDLVTGQHLEIRISPSFTTISVDGRDYYFRRFTGVFDGTGMCMNCSS